MACLLNGQRAMLALLLSCVLGSTACRAEVQGVVAGDSLHLGRQQTASSSAGHRRSLNAPDSLDATGKFTSITIPLDLCGSRPSISNDKISKQVMDDPRSLQAFINSCSFGALDFNDDPRENFVLDKPVPIRSDRFCNGNTVQNCDIDPLSDEAERYLADELGIDMTLYAIKILVFPSGVDKCGFNGLARQGCFTNELGPDVPARACRTWMTDFNSRGLMHETGHNLGLGHANKGNEEAADGTSPLSNWPDYYCPNGYHSHLLGWTKALYTLDINSMSGGEWKNARLPARAATAMNFLQLTGSGLDLYLTYISPVGWEKDIRDEDKLKLLVHSAKSNDDWSRSLILGELSAGDRDDFGGSYPRWVVRLARGASLAGATAQVCRANNSGDCPPGSEPPSEDSATQALSNAKPQATKQNNPAPHKKTAPRPPRHG